MLVARREVIPTVFQDLFISALIGAVFAWTGRNQLMFEAAPGRSRIFRRLLVFQTLIWTPAAGYLLWAYPSWSWWYLLPEERLGLGYKTLPLVAEFLMSIGAFLCIRELFRSGWRGAAAGVMGALGLINFLLFVFPIGLWGRLGTYAQYHAGQARIILIPSRFTVEFTIIGIVFTLGLGRLIRANRIDHRDPRLWSQDRPAWPPSPTAS